MRVDLFAVYQCPLVVAGDFCGGAYDHPLPDTLVVLTPSEARATDSGTFIWAGLTADRKLACWWDGWDASDAEIQLVLAAFLAEQGTA